MAGLIREAHGIDATLTAGTRPGEFSVFVDGRKVIAKLLPLIRPSDEKILDAVAKALR